MHRRAFLKTCAGAATAAFLPRYHAMAATAKGMTKIRDIKTMILQGPRTYTLVRVEADSGHFGIGEAYGSPGVGVKEQVHALKPEFLGKDPLEIDVLYTMMERRTDGSAHSLMRAASGIEMALWDLAGQILSQPTAKLLGGRFRDKVRMYNHRAPSNMLDKASCRQWAEACRADPAGFTAHKFGFPRTDEKSDHARDRSNRVLTQKELDMARRAFENCREAIGFDHDIMVHCHWEYDLRTSIQIGKAVESIKPMWLEDPMIVDYSESWKRLAEALEVPLCTGENLTRRQGFKDFIVNSAIDILHPDLRNTGGFLETKRIADMADVWGLPLATHNTGCIVNTMGTAQWAASIRDYLCCETVTGKGDWMDKVILGGPPIKDGYIQITDKPGIGIELNPDVVKAHLAPGETYWA